MPLIQSKSATAAASILSRVQHLAGNYNAAASHLNAITNDLLALGNDDLAAFCNEQGHGGMNELTEMHEAHGLMINSLSAEASEMLAESGIAWPASLVDVRALPAKLADQGRELVMEAGAFVVRPLAVQDPDVA
jgi:hypothetical protein